MLNVKRLSILGIVLVIVGVTGTFLTFNFMHKEEPVSEEKVMEDKDFDSITIGTESAKVEIISTDDTASKVELTGSQSKSSKNEFMVDVINNELSIKLKNQHRKLYNLDFFTKSLSLKVYLPHEQYDSLRVTSDNGEVDLEHLNVDEINVKSANGRLNMRDITGSVLTAKADNGRIYVGKVQVNDVNMQSNNGSIELSQVEASMIKAETDNGKLMLDDVSGEIIGKTKNGSISLSTNNLRSPITFETDNGWIKIATEERPGNARFDVKVDNGKVNIFDEYNGNAVIGNGDNLIKLTANNGKIDVLVKR